MGAVLQAAASNPLTFPKLIETLAFQVGILGVGLTIAALAVVPWLTRMEAKAMKNLNKAQRILRLLPMFALKGVSFILLLGTLAILLTDIGWPPAIQKYGLPLALIFARASGAPNGAHLLSYIPLPFLGLYVAWKYKSDIMLDCFQGILVVAFGVAVHELLWLAGYWAHYAPYWNLGVATNILEDMGFTLMCVLLVYAFWKYPYRSIPLRIFKWPIVAYGAFIAMWFSVGFPISTINNWQLGKGIYMITPLWADPLTNAIEVASWLFVAFLFFVVIQRENRAIPS